MEYNYPTTENALKAVKKKYGNNQFYKKNQHIDPYGLTLDYAKNYSVDKTFYKLAKDNSIVEGFLIDFKKLYVTYKDKEGLDYSQVGVQLYFKSETNPVQKLHFFLPFNPYFYISIPKEHRDEFEVDLKLYNIVQRSLEDDDCLYCALSNLEIPGKQYGKTRKNIKIQQVELSSRHIFKNNAPFLNKQAVYKIYFRSDKDEYAFKEYFDKKYGKWFENESYGIKEYDIKVPERMGIDLDLRCGRYYQIYVGKNNTAVWNSLAHKYKIIPINTNRFPQLDRFIFDIEIDKRPNLSISSNDPITVISVKSKGKGYLFINKRSIPNADQFPPSYYMGVDPENDVMKQYFVQKRLEDPNYEPSYDEKEDEKLSLLREFTDEEYHKKWKYSPIQVTNIICEDEIDTINTFLSFFEKEQPDYVSGFNSDKFDFPHIEHRLRSYGKTLLKYFDAQIVSKKRGKKTEEVVALRRDGTIVCDAMDWMDRDSYLAQGSRGLKKATKVLLKIQAMETDHEQHIADTIKYKDILDFDPNNEDAYHHFYRYCQYCFSDSYITDIFIDQTIINMNFSLSILVPYTVWEVSRFARGKQCFLKLLESMKGWGIVGDSINTFDQTEINPYEYTEKTQKQILFLKTIKLENGDEEIEEGICYTKREMDNHCLTCPNMKCKEKCRENWNLPVEKQNFIRCTRDEINENETFYYYPLSNNTFPVDAEAYLGARVSIFNKGYFNRKSKIRFRINLEKIRELRDSYVIALKNVFKDFEDKNKTVKHGTDTVSYIIDKPDEIIKNIIDAFDDIIKQSIIDPNDERYGYINATPLLIHLDVSSMYPSIICNWGLQPYAVVNEEDCSRCNRKAKSNETECWFDHEWFSQYKLITLSEETRNMILTEIKKQKKELTEKQLQELYINQVKKINGNRQKISLVFPTKSRICQKSFKFFSYAVRDMKNKKNYYKYSRVKCQTEITLLYKEYENKEMPSDIKHKIDELEYSAVFYRNMELGLKVLLNAYYGYLASPGAKFRSLATTGIITAIGKEIIGKAVEFCENIGKNIELDTDGIWTALVGLIPMEVSFNYKLKNLKTGAFINKDDESELVLSIKDAPNLFNLVFNDMIQSYFENKNNYMPCEKDGVILNNAGNPWNPKDKQTEKENLPRNYDFDPMYYNEWKKHKTYKNVPCCDIKFDYDGDETGYLSVYFKGKKMYVIWKLENGKIMREELKGLSVKRSDGIELIKTSSNKFLEKLNDVGLDTKSIETAWKESGKVLATYFKDIKNQTMDINLLKKCQKLSKTADDVITAYNLLQTMYKTYNINPDEFHLHEDWLKYFDIDPDSINEDKCPYDIEFFKRVRNEGERKQIQGECKKIIELLKKSQVMAAFRMKDAEMTYSMPEWFDSILPYKETNKSFRVIPLQLASFPTNQIRKYLFRWFGLKSLLAMDNDTVNILRLFIDWNAYEEQFNNFLITHFIQPASKQVENVYELLGLSEEDFKSKKERKRVKDPNMDALMKYTNELYENINDEENENEDESELIESIELDMDDVDENNEDMNEVINEDILKSKTFDNKSNEVKTKQNSKSNEKINTDVNVAKNPLSGLMKFANKK